jgi:hypothetical protein
MPTQLSPALAEVQWPMATLRSVGPVVSSRFPYARTDPSATISELIVCWSGCDEMSRMPIGSQFSPSKVSQSVERSGKMPSPGGANPVAMSDSSSTRTTVWKPS